MRVRGVVAGSAAAAAAEGRAAKYECGEEEAANEGTAVAAAGATDALLIGAVAAALRLLSNSEEGVRANTQQ